MKVILLKEVKNVGLEGEVVDVSEGYARNFLFPQHMGIEASETKLKDKEDKAKAAAKRAKKEEQAEKKLAHDLDGVEVLLTEKANQGTLYGSVGPKEVAQALKELGYKVDPSSISFAPKKDVGSYEATVAFESGFEATIRVVVEAKE